MSPTSMSRRRSVHPELASAPGILRPVAQNPPWTFCCCSGSELLQNHAVGNLKTQKNELLKSKASQFLSSFLTGPCVRFLSRSVCLWSRAPSLLQLSVSRNVTVSQWGAIGTGGGPFSVLYIAGHLAALVQPPKFQQPRPVIMTTKNSFSAWS